MTERAEFGSAIADLRTGETIRRAGSSLHSDIYDFPNEPVSITVRDTETGSIAIVKTFSAEEILATDWEIVR